MAVAVRTLVYEGNAKWIKLVLEKSYLNPTNPLIASRGSVKELDRKIYETKEEYDRDYGRRSSGSSKGGTSFGEKGKRIRLGGCKCRDDDN